MSNQQQPENALILTPRQEHLQRLRDDMAPGNQPAAIVPRTFAELITMCQALAAADLAPKALRGKATDMALVIMTGAEVGLPPMASLRLYTTWDGVPRLMAEGMRAIILAHPECEWFRRVRGSDTEVVWSTKRRGQPEQQATWTIERAKRAQLLNKENWQKYPEDMLSARCSMQLARLEWPDVVAGMLSKEEAMDGDFIEVQGTEPKFVAPPPPRQPDAAERVTASIAEVDRKLAERGVVDPMGRPVGVTATDTGAKPTEQRRGPGRPPKSGEPTRSPTPPANSNPPSDSPGTSSSPASSASASTRAAAASAPASEASGTSSSSSFEQRVPAVHPTATDRDGRPLADPTSAAGGSGQPSSAAPTSETPSTASTASAEDLRSVVNTLRGVPDDGFGGEDPQDSQPAPTGDPGLSLIAEFQAFLAACKSQQEMTAGSAPFRQRSAALFKDGDQRFAAPGNGKPAGELAKRMGDLWAERKAQLPV